MMRAYDLINGDCIDVMGLCLADNSVDSIVCDPPYELGFMGKAWDATGIANNKAMWAEALRVLKPGGHLLAFSGSRTYHRMVCAIEDAGFDIRDQIMWVYSSGFPKSKNLADDWQGWGTALKPAHEPICVARKPLVGTVAANVLQFGTGALNISACRVAFLGDGDKASAKPGGKATARSGNLAGQSQGGGGDRAEFEAVQGTGRWPANIIHDGSDEVLAGFPQASGAVAPVKGTESSAARFFYCAKASKRDRNEGCDSISASQNTWASDTRLHKNGDGSPRNKSADASNTHPTVKPTDLMAYLCRLVTPPGGVVLDPFMGSGSTGKAAMREGFRFIGIELDENYMAIARARIEHEFAKRGAA